MIKERTEKLIIRRKAYVDNNCCNSTNYGSRLRVQGSEDEQACWDEELDDV